MPCYKSPDHAECSETFYKQCIMDEMAAEAKQPKLDKNESMKRMYEILARMQSVESNASTISDIDVTEYIQELDNFDDDLHEAPELDSDDEATVVEAGEDSDCADLAERLEVVDLNDADAIWDRLTVQERKDFEQLLHNGDISKIVPQYEPWWEVSVALVEEIKPEQSMVLKDDQAAPKIVANIKSFDELSTKTPNPCVRNNLLNILAAYTFAARFYNGDHQNYPHESAHCVVSICANIKSNWNYDSEAAAIESVASEARNEGLRFDAEDVRTMKSDVQKLLHTPANLSASQFLGGGGGNGDQVQLLQQNLFVLAALSDLYRVLMCAKCTRDNPMREKYSPGTFSKRFADHEINNFGELKRSKISVYLKKIEYFLAYSNKFVLS